MKKLSFVAAILVAVFAAHAQTCTLTASGTLTWPASLNTLNCSEGGTANGKSVIVIPAGLTVSFNNNGLAWTGTTLVVDGRINIVGNVILNSNIEIRSGGYMHISGKLDLGTTAGCGYNLIIRAGGAAATSQSASDQLNICNQKIIKGGGGGCNPNYPAGAPPYCDPSGGLVGPTAVDEGGYNGSLPITLVYFKADALHQSVKLNWATTMEENFSEFMIQRSADGITFENIGEVKGQGFNIYDIESKYSFTDEAPLLGPNYYRLKAVDIDNSYEFSEVRVVKMNGSKKLAVYPNPSTGEQLGVRVNFNPEESDRIMIIDQVGVVVYNGIATGNLSFSSPLRPGIYMLRYISGDFEQVTRIVIKN